MFVLMAFTKGTSPAVFSKLDIKTGDIHYYFSPGAEIVARTHKADPCEAPSKETAGNLIVGDASAVGRFFS